jgi:signal transduction histidine kinase
VSGSVPDSVIDDLRDCSAQARRNVQSLRTLLVDLYPPNLRSEGLEEALSELIRALRARDQVVSFRYENGARLPEETEHLLYRAAREGLRNVLKHADAKHVEVSVVHRGQSVRLTINDDGRGYSAAERTASRAGGHVGLDILADIVRDAGGTCDVTRRDGGGTCFVVEAPLA